MKLFGDAAPKNPSVDHEAENRRLKRELARVTEEFDIRNKARDDARRDVFDCIGMFYNPIGKHTNNGLQSPVAFEIRQLNLNMAGV